MLRKSVVILALLLSSLATQVFALGLGTVTVESALNQPLRVRIEILQLGDTRLQDLTIQMASLADFERFNIDRVGFLSNIQFSIAATPAGNFVTLTSNQIVREPYLSFILDTRWPNGRLLSEHTILLDLPVFDEQQPASNARQPISAVLQPSTAPAQSQPAAPSVTPPASAPPVSAPQSAPAAAPEPATNPPVATPEPATPEPAEPAAPQGVDSTAAPESADAAPSTITTSPDDTLTDLAIQVRPDDSVSLQQTMLAIQRLNPDAFIDGNINRMRSGQVLRIPDITEIQTVDAREAATEITRQNQANATADVQPLAAPAAQTQDQDASPQGTLSVVTADENAIDASAGGASGQLDDAENAELDQRIAELENQLAVQQEETDRARIEREELDARLDDLEQQIAAAQEIIRLQDLQLAQLQDSLAQAAAEQALLAEQQAAAAAAAAPVTPSPAAGGGMFDSVLRAITGNLLYVGIGLALVVLLLVALLLRRNRAAIDDSDLDELDGEEYVPRETAVAGKNKQEFQDYDDDDLDQELDQIIGVDTAGDPVVQAGALLNKGNVPRAVALLQAALDKTPDDNEIRLKLLEAFATQGDLSAFEEQADLIGDNPEFVSKVNTLRRGIKVKGSRPGSVAFGAKPNSDEEDRLGAASFLDDLGIDLDAFDDDDEEPSVTERASAPAPVVEEKKPEAAPSLDDDSFLADDMDLTFDLIGDVDDAPAATEQIDELEDDFEQESKAAESPSKPVAESGAEVRESADFDLDTDTDTDTDSVDEKPEVADEAVLDFDLDAVPDTSAASDSKDAEELEIESFDFDTETPAVAPEQSKDEPEIELETFAFDTDNLDLDKPAEPEPEAPADIEENLLDFDFDKSEIATNETKAKTESAADDLETFEFDVDENPESTVVETPEDDVELDIDTDDFELDDDELDIEVASEPPASTEAPTDDEDDFLDLDALATDSAAADSKPDSEIEFDLDDEVDDETETEAEVGADAETESEPAASKAKDADLDDLDDLDDLEFLSDEDEVEIESVDEVEEVTNFADSDEVATKLELAYAYRKMGDVEGAREILQEVLKEGSPGQAKEATALLSSIDED